jgi:hypothetical protein
VILSPANFGVCDAGATDSCEDQLRDPTGLDMVNLCRHKKALSKPNSRRYRGCHYGQAAKVLRWFWNMRSAAHKSLIDKAGLN